MKLLPVRPPKISTVSKLLRGQPFQTRLLFRKSAFADQKADVAVSLKITGPNGKNLHEKKRMSRSFTRPVWTGGISRSLCIMASSVLKKRTSSGVDQIDLLLWDRNSGECVLLRTPHSERIVFRFRTTRFHDRQRMLNPYCAAPHPEQILSDFRKMRARMEEKLQKGKHNPIPLPAPFYCLLQDNPQREDEFSCLPDLFSPAGNCRQQASSTCLP